MKKNKINNINKQDIFNNKSRSKNVKLTSIASVGNQIIKTLISFIYRTIFLMILSKEYLGLNGLFTNILQIFSLADLGIGSVIAFRLYEPIKNKDINKVSALMNFYKLVYRIIFFVVVTIGILFIPFLSRIVDVKSIPKDINMYIIYVLFLLEVVTSYLFSYKQSLINADQLASITSIFGMISNVISMATKITILVITHNYTLTLLIGIGIQLLLNYTYSLYITYKYREVFSNNSKLCKKDAGMILKDTYATLCHKIGATVVAATDNIVLTKFVGLSSVGIYSNYSMIVSSIQSLLSNVIVNISSSVGNYVISANEDENEKLYLNMQFMILWISSFCAICFFVLLNSFIFLWLNSSFLLSQLIVLTICIQFFLQMSSSITITFINATGLFVKDKFRALIEAALNLSISIILVKKIGIGGVFIGTIVSSLFTYYWRTIYLLYKYVFKRKPIKLITLLIIWILITIFVGGILYYSCAFLPNTIWGFLLKVIICGVMTNVIFFILTFNMQYNKYYRKLVLNKLFNPK